MVILLIGVAILVAIAAFYFMSKNNGGPTLLDGFTKYGGYACAGRNEVGDYPPGTYTLNECAQKCADVAECTSFDFGARAGAVGKCGLSSSCLASHKSSYPDYDLYVRN